MRPRSLWVRAHFNKDIVLVNLTATECSALPSVNIAKCAVCGSKHKLQPCANKRAPDSKQGHLSWKNGVQLILFEYDKECFTCLSHSKQREQVPHRLGQSCGESNGKFEKNIFEEGAGCIKMLHYISVHLVAKNLHDCPAFWSSCFLCLERLKRVVYSCLSIICSWGDNSVEGN